VGLGWAWMGEPAFVRLASPLFAGIMADGAVDWSVVSVVVKDSCDCLGEEKVLFPPPSRELSAPPPVPALEWPASECIVSGFVATVGAADRVLMTRPLNPDVPSSYDVTLPVLCESLKLVMAEGRPLKPGGGVRRDVKGRADSGYGLFLDTHCLLDLRVV
jgi:hypothetical protein